MGEHKIKNIKNSIYYEYIVSNKYDFKFHLISVESDYFNCIIPSNYQIDYTQSNNDYREKGHICFYNDKYNSFIELLKHGANPNFICKKSGETPLIYATNFISERGFDNQ